MKTPFWWQGPHLVSLALAPLSWLYAAGAHIDRLLTKPQSSPVPTIAIGNVTAGGAGKTPTALALAALLQQAGHVPHFISRGYKGTVHHATQVTGDDDWRIVGDEPLLLAKVAPTWVSPRRIDAATCAANHGATLTIADDALQHHALAADVNILVIDGAYGIGNGKILPAGPLRESLVSILERCHAVVMIGEDMHHLTPQISIPVFQAQLAPVEDTHYLKEGKWFAFAGLARPGKFYDTLRSHGAHLVGTHDFADHHPYQESDIQSLLREAARLDAQLITTEKDAVKIPAFYRSQLYILPVKLTIFKPQDLLNYLIPLIFSTDRTK